MNGPIDYGARAETRNKARDEAMDRFLRHYDEFVRDRGDSYWTYSSHRLEDGDGHQFILNLEMEDDE